MARKTTYTDQDLRDYLRIYADEANPAKKVAELFKVSEAAVRQRMAKLERQAAPLHSKVVSQAEQSVWDVKVVLERAYLRLEKLTTELENRSPLDRDDDAYLKAISEARKMAEAAVKTAEAWYRVEETKAFMDDVMATLADVDPAVRDAVLSRIRQRRTLRSAFA